MLTPKKVFVDTIKTVQSLLSSGVSAEPDGVQNSPPRAKHILVPFDYPEKRLHAVHFPGKDIIVFEGSVIGFKQGHSVFGSCDVLNLVLEGFEKAHNNHAFRFTL